MGIFGRINNIIKGKANSALDNIENPIEQLDLSIRTKEEALMKAKKESATLIGAVSEKENNIKKIEEDIANYERAIKAALAKNDEAAAIKILAKKEEKDKLLNDEKLVYETTKKAADNIKSKIAQLNKDIEATRLKSTQFKARYETAKAQGKINELLTDLDKDVNISVSDIERKIIDAENYANGLETFKEADEDADIAKYLNGTGDEDLKSKLDAYR